jgi:hypothetical protein
MFGFKLRLERIRDLRDRKLSLTEHRSEKWPAVRKAFINLHPMCEVCGGTKKLQVHHCLPFHLHPDLELVESNLITLCEQGNGNHHYFVGHLENWKAYNPSVHEDAATWLKKISARPYH